MFHSSIKRFSSVLIIIVTLSTAAHAEMEKFFVPSEGAMCFYWWPKLPKIKGWHHERDFSFSYSVNALAPDGFTFANAETVMYVKALYKPRIPETKSLNMLIESDKKDFIASGQNTTISEVAPLTTADGKQLRSFTFSPKQQGNWEQVSYGEEGDYYLIFTVSSRTSTGFKKAVGIYRQLIGQYKEKP